MREGIRYDWIIAVSNSAESGIKILKTYCKVSEIKQILVDLAKRDARKDVAAFKHGTDDIDQLQVVKHDAPFAVDIGFTACNVFDTYRIDYTAHELEHENYWYSDMSTDDMFTTIFTKTADRIMTKSTTAADVGNNAVKVIGVIVVFAGIIVVMVLRRKHKAEEAKETEKILNTPLNGDSEADDLLKKYKKGD